MKWINHKLTTFGMSYAATRSVPFSALAAVASAAPDLIEEGPLKIRFLQHRGLSHSPVFWVLLFAALYVALGYMKAQDALAAMGSLPYNAYDIVFKSLVALSAGVLGHLLVDALSKSGIPVLGGKRLALGLYKTHGLSEYIVAAAIIAASYYFFIRHQKGVTWLVSYLNL